MGVGLSNLANLDNCASPRLERLAWQGAHECWVPQRQVLIFSHVFIELYQPLRKRFFERRVESPQQAIAISQ